MVIPRKASSEESRPDFAAPIGERFYHSAGICDTVPMNSRLRIVVLLALVGALTGQREVGEKPSPSGGPLSPEQAAYRVIAYDLALEVDPARRFIDGSLTAEVELLSAIRELVLDLDSPLRVESVHSLEPAAGALEFHRTDTQVLIGLPPDAGVNDELRVRIAYSGHPRVAARPPWHGGFVWKETADGQPWVAVACQLSGADLWWPNKDHPSGEPERMDIRITVPEPLVVASNGTLQSVTPPRPGVRTFHWRTVNPINPYSVSINIAPYVTISDSYRSVAGELVPVTYWVLPENLEKGAALFPQFARHLRFFEETVGPYPFRNEKYGVAEVPYLGMEHQTIIAYGHDYSNNEYGFDWLHFHELAHEWFGNLVTAADWNDFWLHEAFASYLEAMYAESLGGREALGAYMTRFRGRVRNDQALAPRETMDSVQKYFSPPDFTRSDPDVNFKGAWVLHSLRYLIGDEAFLESLRRFAYPTEELERATDGSQCRFATTDDFRRTVEQVSGRDLGWFFEVYLRQPVLPELKVNQKGGKLYLRWVTPDTLLFPMPVEVRIGDERRRTEVPAGGVGVEVGEEREVFVDPDQWLLRDQT